PARGRLARSRAYSTIWSSGRDRLPFWGRESSMTSRGPWGRLELHRQEPPTGVGERVPNGVWTNVRWGTPTHRPTTPCALRRMGQTRCEAGTQSQRSRKGLRDSSVADSDAPLMNDTEVCTHGVFS